MGEDARTQHPVDYEVHPVGGIVLIAWGLMIVLGVFVPTGRAIDIHAVTDIIVGGGFALLGLAVRRPAGAARRWLVRGWLATFALFIAAVLYASL